MPSGPFRELIGKLPKHEPALPALSAARLADPVPSADMESLPSEMWGFWMKTWACKDQPKKAWACAGPKTKNINVVFSGYADIGNALDSGMPLRGTLPFYTAAQSTFALCARA